MEPVVEIGMLIEGDPGIRWGRPKIAGTGLTVSRIVGWYKMGISPAETAFEYPHLTLPIGGEIEADVAQEEAAAAQWEMRVTR
jgi:uncharacterized protein (DUF433 family)